VLCHTRRKDMILIHSSGDIELKENFFSGGSRLNSS
jgi:hypothetical protein